jgi:hypothetical protein
MSAAISRHNQVSQGAMAYVDQSAREAHPLEPIIKIFLPIYQNCSMKICSHNTKETAQELDA